MIKFWHIDFLYFIVFISSLLITESSFLKFKFYFNELTFGHVDHSICPASADKPHLQLLSLIMAPVLGIHRMFSLYYHESMSSISFLKVN